MKGIKVLVSYKLNKLSIPSSWSRRMLSLSQTPVDLALALARKNAEIAGFGWGGVSSLPDTLIRLIQGTLGVLSNVPMCWFQNFKQILY